MRTTLLAEAPLFDCLRILIEKGQWFQSAAENDSEPGAHVLGYQVAPLPEGAEWLPATDLLVVCAHAVDTTDKFPRRVPAHGLKRLQELLAHPRSRSCRIQVVACSPATNSGRFASLLCPGSDGADISYAMLPPEFPLPLPPQLDVVAWRKLQQRASESELELECSPVRHALRSVGAAARVLLGAVVTGHVPASDEALRPVLDKLAQLARAEGAVPPNVDALTARASLHQSFGFTYQDIDVPGTVNLWALDDQWRAHGWNLLFEMLLPGRVTGMETWEELEACINGGDDPPDVLLLDCNLGQGATPTGLELLCSIRSRWPTVQIIFMTAFDDAPLALTAMREGANAFFAKTLHDPANRKSKDYYAQLARLLRTYPHEQEVTRLWQQFDARTRSGEPLLPAGRRTFPLLLEPMLRLAFYLLFSRCDDNHWWSGSRWSVDEGRLFGAVVNLVRAGDPDLRDVVSPDLRRIINACGHGAPADFEDMEAVLRELFRSLPLKRGGRAMVPWERSGPIDWPYLPQDLQQDGVYPGASRSSTPPAKDEADRRAAIDLARGFHCDRSCRHRTGDVEAILKAHPRPEGRTPYEGVAYVDPHGMTNGWFAVAHRFLPGCATLASVSDLFRSAPEDFNLVIVDPEDHEGPDPRNVVQDILRWDPSVPVLVLSSEADSLPAIQALRDGAADFFSKSLPFERDKPRCWMFADWLRHQCRFLESYGRSDCRVAWRRAHNLSMPPVWTSSRQEAHLRTTCSRLQAQASEGDLRPASPDDWASLVFEGLLLPLRLWQLLEWAALNEVEAPASHRLDFERSYSLRPLDGWRLEHVLAPGEPNLKGGMVRMVAILASNLVDQLAQWHWCLRNNACKPVVLWGTFAGDCRLGAISIEAEFARLGASDLWKARREVFYGTPKEADWQMGRCCSLVASAFAAIRQFGNEHGVLNWTTL